ncbi:MAG TPA: YraN family protein [Thiolinea sp.]|nr:YraN family protein [Thiolinea sp.]
MTTRQQSGQAAEAKAWEYLQAQGFRLLARNYRLRGGEIDLIVHDGDYLVFVEVRYRSSEQFGGALQSIDLRKQQRIIRTAQHYLMRHALDLPCRFDVIALDRAQQITWLKNAFEA